MTRTRAALAAIALLWPTLGWAQANPNVEQAKMYFDAGAQAYGAARYTIAVQAFEQAYKLVPRPAILFSMAQAERKGWYVAKQADVLRSAIHHYHQYLDQVASGGRRSDAADALAELEPIAARLAPSEERHDAAPVSSATRIMVTSPTPSATASIDGAHAVDLPLMEDVTPGKHRVHVSAPGFFDEDRDIAVLGGTVAPAEIALREKPARLMLTGDNGSDVAIDGRPVATTPLRTPLELAPGSHLLEVTRNGFRAFTRSITLERATPVTIAVHLARTGQRVTSYAVVGAGVASIVAGGVFAGFAFVEKSKAQQILDDRANGNITGPQIDTYNHALDLRDSYRTIAVATMGAGVAAASVGALLFAFDRPALTLGPGPVPKESNPPPMRNKDMEISGTPWLAPGLAGLALGGRF